MRKFDRWDIYIRNDTKKRFVSNEDRVKKQDSDPTVFARKKRYYGHYIIEKNIQE